MSAAAETEIAKMLARGWSHYEHPILKPGVRVRNVAEQYPEAHRNGTAEVVAVLRKPGAWEQKYGRPNIEVLVRRDRDSLGWWADYGTRLAAQVSA